MKTEPRPTAHLLHGFVGAGKTTFARKLEHDHRAVRFTHDEWMHLLYGADPPADRFTGFSGRVDELVWRTALRLLALGIDVILDFGFWTRRSRDEARSRVLACGARPLLYSIDCPEETMRDRVEQRTRHLPDDSLSINQPAFDLFKSRFEPLTDDEVAIRVDGTSVHENASRG